MSLVYLSQHETAAWYAVGKNLRRLKPIVEVNDADRKAIFDKLGEKDSDGNLKVKKVNGVETLDFTDKKKEKKCLDALMVWGKEEVDIPFEIHTVDASVIEKEPLSASILEPLYDIMFVENDDKKK